MDELGDVVVELELELGVGVGVDVGEDDGEVVELDVVVELDAVVELDVDVDEDDDVVVELDVVVGLDVDVDVGEDVVVVEKWIASLELDTSHQKNNACCSGCQAPMQAYQCWIFRSKKHKDQIGPNVVYQIHVLHKSSNQT